MEDFSIPLSITDKKNYARIEKIGTLQLAHLLQWPSTTAETRQRWNGRAVAVAREGAVKDDCQLLGSGAWMNDDAVSSYFI